MARNKSKDEISAVISGLGVGVSIVGTLIRKARESALTSEEIHLLSKPEGEKHFDRLIESILVDRESLRPKSILERFPNARIIREIPLRVDRTVKPFDLLLATKCDYINEWMKTHTPEWKESGVKDETAVVIDMGADYEHKDSLAVIDVLDSGKLEHCPDRATIWTLSKDHPDFQREIWVQDPGTVSHDEDGDPCVAYLNGRPDGRDASLSRVAGRWDRYYRVLARRK